MTLKSRGGFHIQVDWSWDGERFDVVIDGDEESVTPFDEAIAIQCIAVFVWRYFWYL